MGVTDAAWKRTLLLFEENQRRLTSMPPSETMPSAKICRQSPHRTLGHVTACQAAWMYLMRRIRDGARRGAVPVNPDPLYRKLGFSTLAWEVLLARFVTDRAEWRQILSQINVTREIQTPKRVYSAQTLTKRMVEHEKRHLDDLD